MPGGEAGDGFLLKSPEWGGVSRAGGGESSGREGVCGEFFWGGGLNIFFRGRKSHQDTRGNRTERASGREL